MGKKKKKRMHKEMMRSFGLLNDWVSHLVNKVVEANLFRNFENKDVLLVTAIMHWLLVDDENKDQKIVDCITKFANDLKSIRNGGLSND